MTTNTELIADLQSNIVGDPFPLMRKAADAIEALESEIQRQYACIRSHAEITHKAEDERDALAAQLAAAQGQVEEQRKYKDSAYLERNRLVALLSKVFPSGKKKTAIEGWSEDWHGCVYIDLPTGQASWHYHDSQAWLFEHLPEYQGTWDGHTTDEKYERIQGYATPIPQQPAPSDTAITYMTGYSDGREWAKPSQALVVEPVYQYQLANGNWIDQTKESYDYNVKHGQATVRMLYATPQAAPQPKDMK